MIVLRQFESTTIRFCSSQFVLSSTKAISIHNYGAHHKMVDLYHSIVNLLAILNYCHCLLITQLHANEHGELIVKN